MRAAKAAKELQETINGLCGSLEKAAGHLPDVDGSGEYIDSHVKPLLRNICTEVSTNLPANPTAHVAVWLLEKLCAPDDLQAQAKAWLASPPEPIVNPWLLDVVPPEAKKPSRSRPSSGKSRDGASKKLNEGISFCRVDSVKSAYEGELSDEDTGATAAKAAPQRPMSAGIKKSAEKIWTKSEGDGSDAESQAGDEKGDDEDLHIGLDIFKPRQHHDKNRGSIVADAVIAGKRRRFTQVIKTIELELPDEAELLELLRPVKALEGLDDEALKKVSSKAQCRAFQPDENIVPHNTVTDDLHIIISGVASVSVPHKIGDLKRGDMFGNHLLMPTNTPCMQQVQAFGVPVTTLSISSADFEQLGLKDHYITRCTKDRMARNFCNQDEEKEFKQRSGRASLKSVPYEIVQNYEQTPSDREQIQRAVKSNKVLGEVLSLTEQQAEMMSDYMRLVSFNRGDQVILKGDRGDALYIVQQGYLDCTVDDNLEGEFRIREGDAFGELGLLYDAPRTATIRAGNDCRLWVLHRYEFQIVMSMNYCKRSAEYAAMLGKIPYLADQIDENRMDMLAGVVEEISLMETEELCIEGEDTGFLFLVYYGQCESTEKDADGNDVFKRFLNKGDWVGEDQIRDTIAATETVRVCSETAVVVAIDRPTLRMAFEAIKDIEAKGGAPGVKLDGAGRGSLTGEKCDQSIYSDHLAKKKVTNGCMQKRLKKALARHRTSLQREECQWDLRQVEYHGGLGEGSFGKVFYVKNAMGGTAAIKTISKEHILRENLGAMMQAERKIMMLMDSDFIVRLHASFQDNHNIFLVLEPVLGGELFDLYNDYKLYGNVPIVKFHIACVIFALEHMHSLRVIYRDLKLENCISDERGYVKLADMGIAKVAIGKSYTVCGTADYFAPETLKQLGHNRAVDWWACGVLIFIMCSGRSPFDAPEVQQIYKNIIKGFSKVKFPTKFPSDLVDTIKSLCRSKPEERVTMQKGGVENLKEMPFFSKFDWVALNERKLEAPWKPEKIDYEAIRNKQLSTTWHIDDTIMVWDGAIEAPPTRPDTNAPAQAG